MEQIFSLFPVCIVNLFSDFLLPFRKVYSERCFYPETFIFRKLFEQTLHYSANIIYHVFGEYSCSVVNVYIKSFGCIHRLTIHKYLRCLADTVIVHLSFKPALFGRNQTYCSGEYIRHKGSAFSLLNFSENIYACEKSVVKVIKKTLVCLYNNVPETTVFLMFYFKQTACRKVTDNRAYFRMKFKPVKNTQIKTK